MILQFPAAAPAAEQSHSNAYENLLKFFDVCTTPRQCSFYLDAAERCGRLKTITESELFTLRRIGRQKRLDLANPAPRKVEATAPGVYPYHPELGEQEPEDTQMRASILYDGRHYSVDTPLDLKGRGIVLDEQARWHRGTREDLEHWKSYIVTKLAFSKLKEQYIISMKCYLD